MYGPIVAFWVPGASLLMTLLRYMHAHALINGYGYRRCIATVLLWNTLYK